MNGAIARVNLARPTCGDALRLRSCTHRYFSKARISSYSSDSFMWRPWRFWKRYGARAGGKQFCSFRALGFRSDGEEGGMRLIRSNVQERAHERQQPPSEGRRCFMLTFQTVLQAVQRSSRERTEEVRYSLCGRRVGAWRTLRRGAR